MNNSKKIYTALCFAALLTAGCNKSINLIPDDQIPVTQYYKTPLDMENALTGTYANLREIYNTYYRMAETPSDNTRTYAETDADSGPFDKLNWLTTNTGIADAYRTGYRTIANANIVLGRIEAVPFTDQQQKKRIIAEAKFLRALMYFNLVRYFGDVPLVLKELTSDTDAFTYTRTPAAQVYAQIEKDLIEAAPDLLATTLSSAGVPNVNAGRATTGAAKSLLGKVYLQEKKWGPAATVLADVINSNVYRLLSDESNVFGLGNDNNAEIVFAAQYAATGNGEGNSYVYAFVPQPSTGITGVTGASFNSGTLDLWNAFEERTGSTPAAPLYDLRKAVFIAQYNAGALTYYYAKKFVYPVTAPNEGANDWPILRYADVLLMYAEALNNTGKTADAIPYVNQIRQRAGLSPKLLTMSADDTQLAIEKERRIELCFEGQRWYDLIRWGKAVSTLQAFKVAYTANDPLNAQIDIVGKEYKLLYPIPLREIQLNPKLTQNPGY